MVLRVPLTLTLVVRYIDVTHQARVDTMDSERRIEHWNARWMIVAGRVVCTSCIESQALMDCERQFSHARECDADAEDAPPWITLHSILDAARG